MTDPIVRETRVNGHLHSVNGPAIICDNGGWSWWFHGNRHRYYGPATTHGFFKWWIHGEWVKA